MLWQIFQYIRHQCYRKHRKGHGIHSPYLFEFVNGVVFNAHKWIVPSEVLREHRSLKNNSSLAAGEGRTVGSFVKWASVSEKKGKLLYRIVRWFAPEMLVELGTGLGISTLYLATGAPGTPLHSVEGNTDRAAFAAQLVSRNNLGPVSIHWGEMEEKLDEILPLLPGRYFAYVDGNHYYEPTLAYLKSLIGRAGEEAIIVMDDIYWSRGMYRAWKELISWPEVTVSVDLFHTGILLLRKDLNRAHLKLKF